MVLPGLRTRTSSRPARGGARGVSLCIRLCARLYSRSGNLHSLTAMPDRRVPLRTYADVTRAELDCTYLLGQGVAANVADLHAAVAGGPVLTASGSVHIEVPFAEREHAIVLLEQRRRAAEHQAQHDDDAVRCPKCAREDVSTYHPLVNWLLLPFAVPFALVFALVLIPLLPWIWARFRRTHWYCATCHHRWFESRNETTR